MSVPRLAVLCDPVEEGWPSMDLLGEMLVRGLRAGHAGALRVTRVCPPFVWRFSRLPWLGRRRACFNLDRLANRLWHYPRRLEREKGSYDLFHVVDHSYAHLVHRLPTGAAGAFCHDLDAFACLLGRERRPRWFRALARHTLAGLQKAAVVFHLTMAMRRQIERHGLLDPTRLVHAAPGVAPEFTALDTAAAPCEEAPYLLHVGSCIPRKRVDVLLDVFAKARAACRGLRLVQVGGQWSAEQLEQIRRLGLASVVTQRRGLSRSDIADLYRRAAVVLVPSEAEGFGLPVVEALACGAAVVASDIEVLREVGGDAAVYCPVGDRPVWADAVRRLLADPAGAPERRLRLAQAGRFTWAAHARTIAEAYQRLAGQAFQPDAAREESGWKA